MNNKQLYSFLDITSLNTTDRTSSIKEFCKSIHLGIDKGFIPAAICVYPNFISIAKEEMQKHKLPIAAVSGCFPASQSFLEVKKLETELALKNESNEIDIVLNIGLFLDGLYEEVVDEIKAIKGMMTNNQVLKVILETGELKNVELIKKASQLAILGGADFIKTSTGKVPVGATTDAVAAICETIKEHLINTNQRIGIKISGGVRTKQDAITYVELVEKKLGKEQLTSKYFRIGASSLANELISSKE